MNPWLVAHLVAVAALSGVGWLVQLVVYPAFPLVGGAGWGRYHAHHTSSVTRVVALPWATQGVSSVALLVTPAISLSAATVLAGLALVTVLTTVTAAVPVHNRLAQIPGSGDVDALLRANLVRTIAWSASTVLSAALLLSTDPRV